MKAPIFKSNQSSISQILHGFNMLHYLSSAFCPLLITVMFNFLQGGQLENPPRFGGGDSDNNNNNNKESSS